MTRINLIPVEELTDQHLLAEHREIKRIPNIILSWKYSLDNQPKEFTLWKWHVKFFYDKLDFLCERYNKIFNECIKRWFLIANYWWAFLNPILLWAYRNMFNDYIPTQKDIELSRQRIKEKINMKPDFYKYYWKSLKNFWQT